MLQPKIKVNVSMDGRELQVRVRRGVKAPLGRIAGRVRMIARRSLKAVPARSARKNPSRPGEQPHSIFARNKGGHRMRKMWYAEQQPVGTALHGVRLKGGSVLGVFSKDAVAVNGPVFGKGGVKGFCFHLGFCFLGFILSSGRS